ncbi:MAG: hypothetical protein M3Q30_23240 [Actinomycetota bacterium]|nr:hypothetical protein [Actinomycetota bacterium]
MYDQIAARDLADVRRADVLILVGHTGRNGGCATELGIALERGLRVLHVAAERGDNVFTHVPGVEYHRTFNDALAALETRTAVAA